MHITLSSILLHVQKVSNLTYYTSWLILAEDSHSNSSRQLRSVQARSFSIHVGQIFICCMGNQWRCSRSVTLALEKCLAPVWLADYVIAGIRLPCCAATGIPQAGIPPLIQLGETHLTIHMKSAAEMSAETGIDTGRFSSFYRRKDRLCGADLSM
jgi:hypothetical protein